MLLGNIQIEVLTRLHASKAGIQVEELYHYWGKKEGGQLGVAGLERRGLIRVKDGVAFFEKYPPGVDNGSLVNAEESTLDDLTRHNLVYTYEEELRNVENGRKASTLPNGVRKSLQRLGVLKWKILELTDLGRTLLQQIKAQPMNPPPTGY